MILYKFISVEVSSKPNKNVYFTWKHYYAIHLQTVVDHQELFTFYNIGYSVSVHNAKVFWNSKFYFYKNQLFEE